MGLVRQVEVRSPFPAWIPFPLQVVPLASVRNTFPVTATLLPSHLYGLKITAPFTKIPIGPSDVEVCVAAFAGESVIE